MSDKRLTEVTTVCIYTSIKIRTKYFICYRTKYDYSHNFFALRSAYLLKPKKGNVRFQAHNVSFNKNKCSIATLYLSVVDT